MPIYEYECKACGAVSEFLHKSNDAPKQECPHCKALRLERLISAASFHLKGSGWYVTDFRDKKQTGDQNKPGDKDKPDQKDAPSSDKKIDAKVDTKIHSKKTEEST